MKLTYIKTVFLPKLHDELISVGVVVAGRDRVEGKPDGTEITCSEVYIYVPDDTPQSTINKIEAMVNGHDPTPPQQPPTTEERVKALEDAMLQLLGL